jgi:hypothetical protein
MGAAHDIQCSCTHIIYSTQVLYKPLTSYGAQLHPSNAESSIGYCSQAPFGKSGYLPISLHGLTPEQTCEGIQPQALS